MRIALIRMAGEGTPQVRLAGHSLAWHQLQTALALGCERVVCLAEAPGPDLAALQRDTERGGASFHVAAHHRALSGLVRAADTLIVFAPGVMPDREWLAQTFGARAGVAVLSAEGAVEQGFERIDRDRAWAGVLATRGDAVEALTDLPPDADAIGGLLRIALQRGASGIAVPDKWLDDGRWALVASPAAAQRYQSGWYARHVPAPAFDRPAAALAHRGARSLVDRVANAGNVAMGLLGGGTLVAVAGALAGYLGHTTAGLLSLTLGSALLMLGAALGKYARAGSPAIAKAWPKYARDALLDLALLAIAASPSEFEGWTPEFAALALLAVVRLGEEEQAPRPLRPMSDRTLLFAVLAAAAAAGVFIEALGILALIGLALRIFWPHRG